MYVLPYFTVAIKQIVILRGIDLNQTFMQTTDH